VSASIGTSKPSITRTLADVVAFNDAHPEVAEKYGQAIAFGSNTLDTTPGSIDERNYQADRALDLKLTRTCGLDILYNGAAKEVIDRCTTELGPQFVAPTGACAKKFDAVLFPANFGANPPARAGFPSVIVPAGLFQPTFPAPPSPAVLPPGFTPNRSPFGVTFSGPRFSEPRLIGFAFAFEQATQHRVPPASAPELTSH